MLGVPCNQFLWQEPAKELEIAAFCAVTYAVTFPMTEKTHVKGGKAHPFYRWMREKLGRAAHPAWNFHKLLVGKHGEPLAAFKSSVEPQSSALRQAIEAALVDTVQNHRFCFVSQIIRTTQGFGARYIPECLDVTRSRLLRTAAVELSMTRIRQCTAMSSISPMGCGTFATAKSIRPLINQGADDFCPFQTTGETQ